MAELLGVAASGITIAQISAQVGGTVFKLKKLWDEVKNVPDDIADLMEQIDCLSSVMWEAENNSSQGSLPSLVWDELASKSTTIYCRKALQNLTSMIDDISLQINHGRKGQRKIAALKVLLKKDLLKKLEKRLENAIRLLTLAQQSHILALMQVQPNIIIERFTTFASGVSQTQIQSNLESPPDKDEHVVPDQSPKWSNISSTASRSFQGFTKSTNPSIFGRILANASPSGCAVLFQAPKWLSQRAWELESIKSYGAWKFRLRTYSTVRRNSEILRLAKWGSPNDMQKLFDVGSASPYDRDQSGWTLLHWASLCCNFQVVRYLLTDIGLNIWDRDDDGLLPMDRMAMYKTDIEEFTNVILLDNSLSQCFLVFSGLKYFGEDIEITPATCLECSCRQGFEDLTLYKALLPFQCPSHMSTSLESRIRTVSAALSRPEISIEVAKFILEPHWSTNPQAIYSSLPNNISTISIAGRLCRSYLNQDVHDWFSFMVDVVKYLPNMSVLSTYGLQPLPYDPRHVKQCTALICLIDAILWQCTPNTFKYRHFYGILTGVLVTWLEVLEQAGVNLVVYGRHEYELFIGYAQHYFTIDQCTLADLDELPFSHIYLVGFKFGAKPRDWEFYWDEPTDEFAGDFWDMVENPPPHIPGSWVD